MGFKLLKRAPVVQVMPDTEPNVSTIYSHKSKPGAFFSPFWSNSFHKPSKASFLAGSYDVAKPENSNERKVMQLFFFVLGEREKKKTPNPNRRRDILTELHCINSATCLPEQCPLTTSGNAINQQPSVGQQGTALHGQHKQTQPTADQGAHSGDRTGTEAPCHQPSSPGLCSSVYLRSAFTSYTRTTSAAGFQCGGAGNSVPMCSTSRTSVLLRCSPPLSPAGLSGY